jgi:hypothetical protein
MFEIMYDGDGDSVNLYSVKDEVLSLGSPLRLKALERRIEGIPTNVSELVAKFHSQSDRRISSSIVIVNIGSKTGNSLDSSITGMEQFEFEGSGNKEYKGMVKDVKELVGLAKMHFSKDYGKLLAYFMKQMKAPHWMAGQRVLSTFEAIKQRKVYFSLEIEGCLK